MFIQAMFWVFLYGALAVAGVVLEEPGVACVFSALMGVNLAVAIIAKRSRL